MTNGLSDRHLDGRWTVCPRCRESYSEAGGGCSSCTTCTYCGELHDVDESNPVGDHDSECNRCYNSSCDGCGLERGCVEFENSHYCPACYALEIGAVEWCEVCESTASTGEYNGCQTCDDCHGTIEEIASKQLEAASD